jgi:hypothetical protein
MVGSGCSCHDQFYTPFDSFSEHRFQAAPAQLAIWLLTLAREPTLKQPQGSEAATGHTTTALQGPCGRGGAGGALAQRSAAALPPLCVRVGGNQKSYSSVRRSRRSPGGTRSGGRRQRLRGVSPADHMRGAPGRACPLLTALLCLVLCRQLSAAAHAAMYMPKPGPSRALALHTDARWGPADGTACAALWHRRRRARAHPVRRQSRSGAPSTRALGGELWGGRL